MKKLQNTALWRYLLVSFSTLVMVIATASVHIPSDGWYYQPQVPERLRLKD